ncbi:hypothetical protein BDZ97DRAFT_1377192 [Flammula alnicola]|nr:hypothetical protein BDZ97DRAFT_1377192 [Flammula alnicola]
MFFKLLSTLSLLTTVVIASTIPSVEQRDGPPRSIRGYLKAFNAEDDTPLGFVANKYDSFGVAQLVGPKFDTPMLFSVPANAAGPVDLKTINSPNSLYPFFGGIGGAASENADIGPGSHNYMYLGGMEESCDDNHPVTGRKSPIFTFAPKAPIVTSPTFTFAPKAPIVTPRRINYEDSKLTEHITFDKTESPTFTFAPKAPIVTPSTFTFAPKAAPQNPIFTFAPKAPIVAPQRLDYEDSKLTGHITIDKTESPTFTFAPKMPIVTPPTFTFTPKAAPQNPIFTFAPKAPIVAPRRINYEDSKLEGHITTDKNEKPTFTFTAKAPIVTPRRVNYEDSKLTGHMTTDKTRSRPSRLQQKGPSSHHDGSTLMIQS